MTLPGGSKLASRPVYVYDLSGASLVQTKLVDFTWYPGMSISQKQKSISSLHAASIEALGINNPLEISTKSTIPLGVELSAFNLSIKTISRGLIFSVECAYQSSKVFEHGGPFTDIRLKTSREAKKDDRLHNSGRLIGFEFFGQSWRLEPRTAFYDWLYIRALEKQRDLARKLLDYDAFTDIEFNPQKSINCQAYSAALYVSLVRRNLLDACLESVEDYLKIVGNYVVNNSSQNTLTNPSLLK